MPRRPLPFFARPSALLACLCWTAAACWAAGPVSAQISARSQPTLRCVSPPGSASTPRESSAFVRTDGPEVGTGFIARDPVYTRRAIAVTAHPLASRAACEILARGGSALDAAVAAQMVLTLVEPQSSGIGGGAFLLYHDAARGTVSSYDGRETAPAAALPEDLRRIDPVSDRGRPKPTPRLSGRSIGTPGVLRMLELAHRDHGRLPWSELFRAGIDLSEHGFTVSPRLSASIASEARALARDPDARAYFLDQDANARAAGTTLRNPALAATLRAIAKQGAEAFYTGEIAEAIVAKIGDATDGITPGKTTMADLAGYQARQREPICTSYRQRYIVCGMGPPSSGGIAVAATLGLLEPFDLAALAPRAVDHNGGRPAPQAMHLITEAERLAYADRDRYVADTDFVPLPGGSVDALLDKAYLHERARRIDPAHSMGVASPGEFGSAARGDSPIEEHGTSHLTIADASGNVVSMTTTVEGAFGSHHFVRGFLLNNELTDFSASPFDAAGRPVANALAPGKRPRSSMAPTLVFAMRADGSRGELLAATGSPGGGAIIQYVVQSLVAMLDWGLDAQQAASMVHFGAFNSPITTLGSEHPEVDASARGANDPLARELRSLGHTVAVRPQVSGLAVIQRVTVGGRPAWVGGADPRREGAVVGDVIRRPMIQGRERR